MPDAPYPRTLTHARLRRAHGDTRGAIAILEALIDAGEEGEELQQLYLELGGDRQHPHFEPELVSEQARHPAGPGELTEVFRRELASRVANPSVRRLERWLRRIRREIR
jgi:hypothetical protein